MSTVTQLPNGQNSSDSYVMRVRKGQPLLVTSCVCACKCVEFFQTTLASVFSQFPNFNSSTMNIQQEQPSNDLQMLKCLEQAPS